MASGSTESAEDRELWQRGFDGLVGTVYRYVETLCEGEWGVMSGMCGETWEPRRSDYRPPDMPVL